MGIVRNLGMDSVYKVFKLRQKGCFGHCFALAFFSLQLAEIWRSLFYFKLLPYYCLYIYLSHPDPTTLDRLTPDIPLPPSPPDITAPPIFFYLAALLVYVILYGSDRPDILIPGTLSQGDSSQMFHESPQLFPLVVNTINNWLINVISVPLARFLWILFGFFSLLFMAGYEIHGMCDIPIST